jgi:hypothetical protein
MTYARTLQDWTSQGGNANVVTQGEVDWLDISDFQDVILNMELAVVSSSSNTYLDIQSSPTKEEAFFGASPGAAYLYRYSLNISSPRVPLATLMGPPIARVMGPGGRARRPPW